MASRDASEPGGRRGWTDREVDVIISRLLRLGLLVSAALVAAGGAVFLVRHGGETAAYGVFKEGPRAYREIGGILRESAGFHGRGLILAGLGVLIATPVGRVAFSVLAFFRQGDRVFVAVTLTVLAILLAGVLGLGVL